MWERFATTSCEVGGCEVGGFEAGGCEVASSAARCCSARVRRFGKAPPNLFVDAAAGGGAAQLRLQAEELAEAEACCGLEPRVVPGRANRFVLLFAAAESH